MFMNIAATMTERVKFFKARIYKKRINVEIAYEFLFWKFIRGHQIIFEMFWDIELYIKTFMTKFVVNVFCDNSFQKI